MKIKIKDILKFNKKNKLFLTLHGCYKTNLHFIELLNKYNVKYKIIHNSSNNSHYVLMFDKKYKFIVNYIHFLLFKRIIYKTNNFNLDIRNTKIQKIKNRTC